MKVRARFTVANVEMDILQGRLRDAGYPVEFVSEEHQSDVRVALVAVGENVDPSSVVELWTDVTDSRSRGFRVVGVSTTPAQALPPVVRDLPIDHGWYEFAAGSVIDPLVLASVGNLLIEPGMSDASGKQEGNRSEDRPPINGSRGREQAGEQPRSVDGSISEPASGRSTAETQVDHSPTKRNLFKERVPRSIRSFINKESSEPTDLPDDAETVEGKTIFVSYSRRDRTSVDALCDQLKLRGHTIWRDTESIAGGGRWRESIERAIGDSDIFLLLVSPNVAREPRYPSNELDVADSLGKVIIPVYLKRTPALPEGFSFSLAGIEAIFLYQDDGLGKLLDRLGGSTPTLTLKKRADLAWRRVQSYSRQHDLPQQAKTAGLAIAAVVAAAAAVHGQKQSNLRQKKSEDDLGNYYEEVFQVFTDVAQEISFSSTMTAWEYRDEFRPKAMRSLGRLEVCDHPTLG